MMHANISFTMQQREKARLASTPGYNLHILHTNEKVGTNQLYNYCCKPTMYIHLRTEAYNHG